VHLGEAKSELEAISIEMEQHPDPKWVDRIVLRASIDASDIVFWDNSRNEQEVVVRRDISAELDPEPETWADVADNVIERIKAAEKARLEEHKLKLATRAAPANGRRHLFLRSFGLVADRDTRRKRRQTCRYEV
jgi:hypothetical protein